MYIWKELIQGVCHGGERELVQKKRKVKEKKNRRIKTHLCWGIREEEKREGERER